MYEALVARVRYHIQKASFMGLKDAESTLLLGEAADAIEELSKRVPPVPHGALMDRDDFFATCPELVDGYKHITDDLVVIPAEEEV